MKRAFIILLFCTSCTEHQRHKMSCEIEGVGFVELNCISQNPYNVYVDGKLFCHLSPNSSLIMKIKEGEHQLSFEQESGYLLWKTVEKGKSHFSTCDTVSYIFPND